MLGEKEMSEGIAFAGLTAHLAETQADQCTVLADVVPIPKLSFDPYQ